MSKEEDFLKEYKELCLKHSMQIIGCGDCGSAWLEEISQEELKHKLLTWNPGYTEIGFADNYDIETKDDASYKRSFL